MLAFVVEYTLSVSSSLFSKESSRYFQMMKITAVSHTGAKNTCKMVIPFSSLFQSWCKECKKRKSVAIGYCAGFYF